MSQGGGRHRPRPRQEDRLESSVVTVGEKIGKSHPTYAQGGAAETVAMCTILLADHLGVPVSTTHVLSSGVAGTMAFTGSGLQAQTLRNILLAWVLTLPVCIFLGSMLFAFGNFLVSASSDCIEVYFTRTKIITRSAIKSRTMVTSRRSISRFARSCASMA